MPTIKQMKKIAEKSDHTKNMHASLLYSGQRLLASAHNTQALHAEINCLKKYGNILKKQKKSPSSAEKLHMVNFMIKRSSGNFGISKPCEKCMLALWTFQVEKVTYYDGQGFVQAKVTGWRGK